MFKSQDPYITFWNGNYYYSDAGGGRIQIRKSRSLTGLGQQTPYVVWARPSGSHLTSIWAPEIHEVDGSWYIYFSADTDSNRQHKLYVIQGGSDPLDSYGDPVPIVESSGKWAIDPDVFAGADGNLYLTWSCTNDAIGMAPQSICLARMSDPFTTVGATVRIAAPSEAWETRTAAIEEGPVGFVHDGATYITYSGSASWVPNSYSVGVLINATSDLLNPQAWVKHGPVFDHHDRAYGPGSVVFVTSPDGTELWSLYHAYDNAACAAWSCRSIRMQKVRWDADACPLLGYPLDPSIPSWAPSGDSSSPTGWGDSRTGTRASGEWSYNSSSSLDSAPSVSGEWQQTFRGDPNLIAYSVSVDMQASAGAVVCGVFALYVDSVNHVEAFIDTASRTFVSAGTVGAVDMGRAAHALPPEFDVTAWHNLRVDKAADGEFSFYLDGVPVDDRTFALEYGQAGVFAAGAATSFRNVSVSDTSAGWGDAFGDAAEGLPRDGAGFVKGPWKIHDGASITSTGLGAGRHTLYQGNPNFNSFTTAVTAQLVGLGSSVDQPGFGLIACYDDRNNQASLWVRPAEGKLELDTVVQGQNQSLSLRLPAGFDATQPHTLSCDKVGSLFVFALDGNEVLRRNIGLSNGVAGVATEDAVVQFQNFAFQHP